MRDSLHGNPNIAWFPAEQASQVALKNKQDRSQSSDNLTSEAVSHYFCHILLVRNKSLEPALPGGEGITQMRIREYQYP